MGFTQVVYGNGCFVAAGWYSDYGGFYSSPDGLHWAFQYLDGNSWGLNLSYSQGHFVSVSPWCSVLRSTDGTNWSQSFLPWEYYYLDSPSSITYGRGVYAWVGQTNGVGTILASSDGVNWIAPTINPGPGGPIARVIFGGDRFVAVGQNDSFVYISTRGTNTWTRYSLPNGFSGVNYFNGIYFSPASAGTNLLSNDALNWAPVSTGIPVSLSVFGYVKGLFMALATGNKLATSVNGTNWVLYGPSMPLASWPASDGTRLVTVNSVLTNTGPWYFNSFVTTSDVLLDVRMTNTPTAKVALSGLVGRTYQIQSTDSLKPYANNWLTNSTIQLTNTPFVWADPTATNSQRFYRGVLLP